VLFTKEDCKPCKLTVEFMYSVFSYNEELANYISVLKKENHTALINAYEITMFPTLLIVNEDGEVQERFTGGKEVRGVMHQKLQDVRAYNREHR